MDIAAYARALRAEALAENERRGLVLAGDQDRCYADLKSVLEALEVPITRTTLVGSEDRLRCEQVPQRQTGDLLGTTREIVIVDGHETLEPNALGRVVGTVDGGGLFVLLLPSLSSWSGQRGAFEHSLAVPPFDLEDVTGRWKQRLTETLEAHRGIAIIDVDDRTLESEGLVERAPQLVGGPTTARPSTGGSSGDAELDHEGRRRNRFPTAAYTACYTDDQRDALEGLERLHDSQQAVVLEADRGRGKSSAIGLAAGCFASAGEHVLVTAPAYENVEDVFARASGLLEKLEGDTDRSDERETTRSRGRDDRDRQLVSSTGGLVEYVPPLEAVTAGKRADVVLVDEAAALSVDVLESLLANDRIAFATTIHGYEGAGRGFSVRFRDRLEASDHEVTTDTLHEPIRYASGDPLEAWSFRALLLDARPPVAPLVEHATPESVTYRQLDAETLLEDESLLREVFGLLVLAHYRTEPNDLARLLDAPNLEVCGLFHDGHVVTVGLLAREGGLDADTRQRMYEGDRVRGNMIPDILTAHLRDEDAGALSGLRVVRIATHHAVRSRGLGSHLLERLETEYWSGVDWLGTGFGATAPLVSFWNDNGYRTIHLSTTRNATSGEHSAIMLRPTSEDGEQLLERHGAWFANRLPAMLSDTLRDLDPDVIRAVADSIEGTHAPPLGFTDQEWHVVAGAAYGPGRFAVDPDPFRRVVTRYLIERPDALTDALTAREERLLVRRVLQCQTWETVADELEYPSSRQCRRAFGNVLTSLVDHYGTDQARAVRERFLED
ncbi:tRNA(Met) cytidine acetyltransferase TmcA [Natrialbaceae archaeon A-CW3]